MASQVAVEQAVAFFRANPELSKDAIQAHLDAAQAAVLQRQAEEPQLASMRTTLVMLMSDYESVLWAHIGDARLYHFRNGSIVFQTKDHSVPQVMVAAGDLVPEDIRFHEDRNRLLRVLGQENDWRPTLLKEPALLESGDAFLLCTDGFWEYVTEPDMTEALAEAGGPESWLKRMNELILERAEDEFDNFTAIALYCENA